MAAPTPESPRTAWRKAMIVSASVFLPVGLWLMADSTTGRQLEQARAKFADAGFVTRIKELPPTERADRKDIQVLARDTLDAVSLEPADFAAALRSLDILATQHSEYRFWRWLSASSAVRDRILLLLERDGSIANSPALLEGMEHLIATCSKEADATFAQARVRDFESLYSRFYVHGEPWVGGRTFYSGGTPTEFIVSVIPNSLLHPWLAIDLRRGYAWFLEAETTLRTSGSLAVADLHVLRSHISSGECSASAVASSATLHEVLCRRWEESMLRATAVALAATEYRQVHNGWPQMPGQLPIAAGTLLEAGSTRPFDCHFTDVEIMVQGFGVDGDDDHGRPAHDHTDFGTSFIVPHDLTLDGDIVVRVRLPQRSMQAD